MTAAELQQSMFEEANRIEIAQLQEQQRKKAFRVAFEFLESHMPPRNTEEYWTRTCADIGRIADENHDNQLCQELLIAVITYLESEVGELK